MCLGLRWLLPGRAGTAASPETRRNAPLAARELAGATSDSCHQAPAPRAGAILGRVADDETDEPTGVPLSWGGAAGNYTEGDARFSRALIVHEGKPNQIRWLVRSAELMPYHAETLSQPMRTLRRQLWALQDAFKAVDHDFRNAESRLEQLNSLLLQVRLGLVPAPFAPLPAPPPRRRGEWGA